MIAAVVLAAGKSLRMGTQKLLLPAGGQPLIVHVVKEVLRAGVDRVIVVLSPESTAISEALAALPFTPAINPQPAGDMLSSVRCGLLALPLECTRFLLVLGDQPGITADLVARLIAAGTASGRSLTVPVCRGQRGHPVLISMLHRDEILTRHDGTGLRGLLHSHRDEIGEIDVDDPAVLEDVDYPADYSSAIRDGRFKPED